MASQKFAYLRVGINKYGNGEDLAGCLNDLLNFRETLRSFSRVASHEVTLTNKKATPAAIRKERDALLRRPEELLILQFSGHGTAIWDLSGDEPDRTDQAFVPYGYRQDGMLIDDEWAAFAERCKLVGKRAIVILDCCYAGNSSFAFPFRNTAKRILHSTVSRALPSVPKSAVTATRAALANADHAHTRTASRVQMDGRSDVYLTNSSVIFVEMSRANETAADAWIAKQKRYEGAGTMALCEAWLKNGASINWLQLVAAQNALLSSYGYEQRAVIEGRPDLLQQPVFL